MQYYIELNNPGSGSLAVHRYSTGASDLTIGKLIRVSYRGQERGGFFIENVGYDQVKSGEHAQEWKKVTGRGAMAVLEDGIVYPSVGSTESSRVFTSVTMASMLLTLIAESKARGCFPSLRTDFSATLDSNGDPWTDVSTLTFNVDLSLLDVVGQLVDLGLEFRFELDWVLGDYVLYAYQTPIGSDVSDSVVFRPGLNCTEVAHKEDSGELKNALRVTYNGGSVEIKDNTSITAYRRREAPLQVSTATSSAGATLLATPQLTAKKDPKLSISVKLEDGTHNPRAFVDYQVGDWVGYDDPDKPGVAPTLYRVRGMMLDWGEDRKHASVTVDLNSIRLERELLNAIALRKLGNGVIGSSTSSPMPEGVAAAIDAHNADNTAHASRTLSGGDLSGTIGIPTVAKLRGKAIKNPLTLSDGHLLKWSDANQQFEPGYIDWTEIEDKPSTFVPSAHAGNHASGGSDAVKLDDLAAPDDNTDLDASTNKHGLMKKFPGGTTYFLRADGSFAEPPGASGGAASFTDLGDVPASYSGEGGKAVKVKADESGLEFDDSSGGGDVTGPSSSIDGEIVAFDSTTGKIIKQTGIILVGLPPSSPSAYDDEFTDTSLSGWTTLGTLDTLETTTWRSNAHLKRAQSSWNVDGIFKAAPTSYPFTVETKLSDMVSNANYQSYGIMLLDSTPTKLITFGSLHQGSSQATVYHAVWNSRTSRASVGESALLRRYPQYFRLTISAANNISKLEYSFSGKLWVAYGTTLGLSFNVANIGLYMTSNDNAQTCEAYFDYFRVSS